MRLKTLDLYVCGHFIFSLFFPSAKTSDDNNKTGQVNGGEAIGAKEEWCRSVENFRGRERWCWYCCALWKTSDQKENLNKKWKERGAKEKRQRKAHEVILNLKLNKEFISRSP